MKMTSKTKSETAAPGRANRHRGEVDGVFDGERRILCLTLGALAELETAFAADNLAALATRFSSGRLTAQDMIRLIGAGLRGGGNLFTDEEVAQMSVAGGGAGAARLVAELLAITFGSGAPEGETGAEAIAATGGDARP